MAKGWHSVLGAKRGRIYRKTVGHLRATALRGPTKLPKEVIHKTTTVRRYKSCVNEIDIVELYSAINRATVKARISVFI